MRKGISVAGAALLSSVMLSGATSAGVVPYPDEGAVNTFEYTFAAAHDGDVYATFAGSSAGYNQFVGAILGGTLSAVSGLPDHSSSLGDTIDFGPVVAGGTITFIDYVISSGDTWSSDVKMNWDGVTHVYATPVAANGIYAGSPAGLYVAFEDLPKGRSDFDYNDIAFIVQNAALVPEVSTWEMMLLGFAGLAFAGIWASRKNAIVAT